MDRILSHLYSPHILTIYFPKVPRYVIFPFLPRSFELPFSEIFPHQNSVRFLILGTCPANPALLHFSILTIHKHHLYVISWSHLTFLDPGIFFRTLFSNICSWWYSLKVRDHIPHQHKTIGKICDVYTNHHRLQKYIKLTTVFKHFQNLFFSLFTHEPHLYLLLLFPDTEILKRFQTIWQL
jgi:hypothetical protein